MQVVNSCIFFAIGNDNHQVELHTLFIAFGNEEPVGQASGTHKRLEKGVITSLSMFKDFDKTWWVWDGYGGLPGLTGDCIGTSSQFDPEPVQLNGMPTTLIEGELNTIVVLVRPGEDTDCSQVFFTVVVDNNLVGKVLVVETRDEGGDFYISDFLCVINSIDEIVFKVFKVGFQLSFNCYLADCNSSKFQLFLGVGSQRILVLPEYIIHILVKPEEAGVTGGCFKMF